MKVLIKNILLHKSEYFFLVEIDFALGSKVFGFRDRRNGKFVPKANYSIRIDAFCDGIRYKQKISDHL